MTFEPLGQAMAEHTKLPWKLETDQHFGPGFVITSTDGGMHNRCPVVRMSSPLGEDDETLRGDAELIVKACNSHDALVKALEEIAYPIRAMQARLRPDEKLDGVAANAIANNAEYLRSIALKALSVASQNGCAPPTRSLEGG